MYAGQSVSKDVEHFVTQHTNPHIFSANSKVLPPSCKYFVAAKEAFTVLYLPFTLEPCKSYNQEKVMQV